MRETSELPTASLRAPIVTRHSAPQSSPVIPALSTSFPHPPTSFPRRRESPRCVHTPEATALLPPSTEIDTMRQSSTKHNENSCPPAPARTRQRHSVGFLPAWIAAGSSQRIGLYVIPALSTSFPRRRESPRCVHTPEATALLPPSTEIDTMRQSSTKHNENSCPPAPARTRQRHSVGFLPAWIAAGSSQRIGLYVIPAPTHVIPTPTHVIPAPTHVIPAPTHVIPAKAGISRCAPVAADWTHRSELPSPSRHAKRSNRTRNGCANAQGDSRSRVDHRTCDVEECRRMELRANCSPQGMKAVQDMIYCLDFIRNNGPRFGARPRPDARMAEAGLNRSNRW